MKETLDDYFFNKEEPIRSCILALRDIILSTDNDITVSLKWHIPCFSYKRKMLCFINIEKKSELPYILFVNGNKIDHPALEQGERKQMKILRIKPSQDLPLNLIQELLARAIDLRL